MRNPCTSLGQSLKIMDAPRKTRIYHTTIAAGLFVATSILISLFLYYIDEGHYTLIGILKFSNLLGLGLYFGFIFGIQFLIFFLLKRKVPFLPALILALAGMTTIFLILYWFVS